MKIIRRSLKQRIILVLPSAERIEIELTESSRTRSAIGVTAPSSVRILAADRRDSGSLDSALTAN